MLLRLTVSHPAKQCSGHEHRIVRTPINAHWHQLWHILGASGTNKQILLLFLWIRFLGKRGMIHLGKSDLWQSPNALLPYGSATKCTDAPEVWSEDVVPWTAVLLAMLQTPLKHFANTHRAFLESCEIHIIPQFRNTKIDILRPTFSKVPTHFLALDFTLFFLPWEATSHMQENCWKPWQNQEYKFGSWALFPVVWTLDSALLSLAEAKAKGSTPLLKQASHADTLDNDSPQN